jgi:hypothetical protein
LEPDAWNKVSDVMPPGGPLPSDDVMWISEPA